MNIFLNDLLSTFKLSDLFNFADDKTISAATSSQWLTEDQMIVNPGKLQAMILQNSRNSKNYEPIKPEIESAKIETRCIGKEQKEALLNSFIFSNFNYCPLVWHFCSCKSS